MNSLMILNGTCDEIGNEIFYLSQICLNGTIKIIKIIEKENIIIYNNY